MHGGKQDRGVAHHSTTTGRYSKDLPTAIAARVAESYADPDLLNLRTEIAVVDARIGELLAQTGDEKRAPGAWLALAGWVEQRRKLVDSERKRLVDMQQMVTAEQAAVLVAALTDAVRRNVDDPETLAAIAREFDRLLAHPGS